MNISVQTILPGQAQGPVIASDEPISFWGGVDPATGRVIDIIADVSIENDFHRRGRWRGTGGNRETGSNG